MYKNVSLLWLIASIGKKGCVSVIIRSSFPFHRIVFSWVALPIHSIYSIPLLIYNSWMGVFHSTFGEGFPIQSRGSVPCWSFSFFHSLIQETNMPVYVH